MILPEEFYCRANVVRISEELLGKHLVTCISGLLTAGMIIETEAYRGPEDQASHAANGRLTERNKVMYEKGGLAYVYLCYGIHHLFNVVTNVKGIPHAVLIRAIAPLQGIDIQLKRRNMAALKKNLASGPGALSQALGITTVYSGHSLLSGTRIWIEDTGVSFSSDEMLSGPRIGVPYAGEDALLPWRFRVKEEALFDILKNQSYPIV